MKSRNIGVLFCLVFVLAAVVPVYAKATVTTFSDPFSVEFPDINPCTGEPVTINITGDAKTHIVEDGSGKVNGTFKLRAVLTETIDGTGEVFQGSVNWNESFGPDRDTFIMTGTVIHPGPKNNVIIHSVFHLSPNGMSFETSETEKCR
jgi:hypothetical protein